MYLSRIEKLLCMCCPIPLCIVDANGKVSRTNSKIDEVFLYDGIGGMDIFQLTGIKHQEFVEAATEEKNLTLSRNGKVFKIQTSFVGKGETASVAIYFIDITNFENLKTLHAQDQTCMAIISIDNYDELIATAGEESQMSLSTQIDKVVRAWAAGLEASITKHKEHMYFLVFRHKHYLAQKESKFEVLDEVRKIETDADFPVTLSIGVGMFGKTPAETDQYAADALEIALGRGGDQAVVKKISELEYYGGKTQTVEKRNKGKSRIIAHALKQYIKQSSRVIIMGHRNPDMDCFGAALGISRIAAAEKKDSYIVINNYNEALTSIYQAAKETEDYEFINSEKAMALYDHKTLVVVLDTHRPGLVECPELLSAGRLVVIDHHRKAEDAIPNSSTILSYMEPYASSTCELVAEMLQYILEKKTLNKMTAEALLAGITVDTNRFAVKTGVRTYEAASWLRRSGADSAVVKRYFQSDLESFQTRAKCIANAQYFEGGIATSVLEGQSPEAQIINSQVADELLTVQGVRATFVAGRNHMGNTVVSARSLGDVNVQVIMEKVGGGGHLNTAGAQVEESPEEILEKLKEIAQQFL